MAMRAPQLGSLAAAVPHRVLLVVCALLQSVTTPPVAAASEQERAANCETRVIVGLAQAASPPDEKFVTELARAADVELAFIRTVMPGLYVFSLTSAESDPDCREALERLRRDERVRSADIDARRAPHAQTP